MMHDKLWQVINPLALLTLFCITLFLSLSVYQLVVFGPSLRYIAQVSGITAGICFLCEMSEIANNCNQMLTNSLLRSDWTKCCAAARKDVLMILRRTQRPNYFSFHGGVVRPSRSLILKVLKATYSFVNCMRVRLKQKNIVSP
uniref:Uncharacterized protein n=1 Tax=Cacopsylla melanoneura TaxID=428564 RepID=A0A8D9E518_9HEMI